MSEPVMAETEAAADGLEEPRSGGRVQAAAAGLAPILLGAVAAWLSLRLEIGSLTAPGPGLWPLIVAGLLIATGVGCLVALRTGSDTEAFTKGVVAVAVAAIALGAYALVFEYVGFEIPTLLLLAAWLRFLSRESWLSTAVISVSATAVAYALFILALDVPLPHLIAL